jgi:hypothetical protein
MGLWDLAAEDDVLRRMVCTSMLDALGLAQARARGHVAAGGARHGRS